ncbi:M4 family metallopeptidase [Lysobacter sp. GCM10012299]|uniref:M4 family metallopeptidase n=1 Tax=Lysobacter sp. GCM10012299 TaxID=3317333 RepID=UPI003607AEC4
MDTKQRVLTASILLAIATTATTAWMKYDRDAGPAAPVANDTHLMDTGTPRTSPATSSAHTSTARRLGSGFVPTIVASGTTAPAELQQHPVVEQARELLRKQKLASAAAANGGLPGSDEALAAEVYRARDLIIEADGSQYVRFDRQFQGLPVIGGGMVAHMKDGQLRWLNKTMDLQLGDGTAPAPALSADDAIADASAFFMGSTQQRPEARMVYFAEDNQPRLAYEVAFRGTDEAQRPAHELVYVDADKGGFLGKDALIVSATPATGRGFTIGRGQVALSTSKVSAAESDGRGRGFLLRDDRRGGGTVHDLAGANVNAETAGNHFPQPPMFDLDNLWGDERTGNAGRSAAEVHYGVSATWDYYLQQYERHGIHGDATGVKSYVNGKFVGDGGEALSNANAFWDGSQSHMVYGTGEPGVTHPLVAIDVAGHEMTHGVTDATSNLFYSADAGGLNESSSDIHGTLVEFFDNNANDPPDYLMGEGVRIDGSPLRYLFKPSLDRRSFDCYPAGGFKGDFISVRVLGHDPHYTSGVGNHFFYLLAEGQVVPASHRATVRTSDLTCNGAVGLEGIGRDAAGKIWYRAGLAMTERFTYPQARQATQVAAQELVDKGLMEATVVNAVACAWEAVSVPLPRGSSAARCLN